MCVHACPHPHTTACVGTLEIQPTVSLFLQIVLILCHVQFSFTERSVLLGGSKDDIQTAKDEIRTELSKCIAHNVKVSEASNWRHSLHCCGGAKPVLTV